MYDPFAGLALILLVLGLFWLLWKMMNRDRDRNYLYLEDGLVRKIAEKLDVDIEKEKFRQEYNPNQGKVRSAIEKKILKEFFDDSKEK